MIKTPLGYNISITKKIVPNSKQIVIIISATGVVKQFYKYFAEYLVKNDISVVTFDYAGIGKSKPISLRNFNTSAQKWATNDLDTVIRHVKEKYPKKVLTLIGHSIGGQLIGLCPSAAKASNIILIGTQSGYYKFWPWGERMKMMIAWKILFPIFNKTMGYIPTAKFTAMEDLPGDMAMEWAKWCLSPGYLFDHIPKEELYFDDITVPIYSYSTDHDKFASPASTDWITEKFSNAKTHRIHLKPSDYGVKQIGHFGYFQRKCKKLVWPELLSKIKLGD